MATKTTVQALQRYNEFTSNSHTKLGHTYH